MWGGRICVERIGYYDGYIFSRLLGWDVYLVRWWLSYEVVGDMGLR